MRPRPELLLFIVTLAANCFAGQAVELVEVTLKRMEREMRLPGELLPYQSVDIHARVTGYVEEVLVDKGSSVKAGQLLIRLSAPELNARRAEAESKIQAVESQRAEANARLVAAQTTYEMLQVAARTPGAIAENELVLAVKAVDAARALSSVHMNAAKAARASLDALKQIESYLQVTAPFDGIITERGVHPGALVGPESAMRVDAILRIEQHSRLRLSVPVPETAISGIAKGARVVFAVPAYPDEAFTGVLARIPGSLDPTTRSMAVEVDVDNPGRRLAPGMYAEVHWPVRKPQPSFFVPASSIVVTTERMFVIRFRDGRAQYVPVSRGATQDGLVEVFGALAAGDQIVKRGTDEIRDGAALSVTR
jgi:membrane fusion protein (multidrug efflux system)